jgi:hypothetical protein
MAKMIIVQFQVVIRGEIVEVEVKVEILGIVVCNG